MNDFPVGTVVRFRGEEGPFRVAAEQSGDLICVGEPSKRREAIPYVIVNRARRSKKAYLDNDKVRATGVEKECERLLTMLHYSDWPTSDEMRNLQARMTYEKTVPLFMVQEGVL